MPCCFFSSSGTSVCWYGDGGPAAAASRLQSLWRHLQGVHPFQGSILRLGQGQEEVHPHPAWIQRHDWVWLDMRSLLQSYMYRLVVFLFFLTLGQIWRAELKRYILYWDVLNDSHRLRGDVTRFNCEETAVQKGNMTSPKKKKKYSRWTNNVFHSAFKLLWLEWISCISNFKREYKNQSCAVISPPTPLSSPIPTLLSDLSLHVLICELTVAWCGAICETI